MPACAADRAGSRRRLWLGTNSRGALRYDPRTGHVQRYAYREGQPSGLSHPTVHAIAQDRRGRIWMGTSDGLDLLDPATGRLRHFRHRRDGADSLAGNLRARRARSTADGTIWIGTHAGLSRVVEVRRRRIRFAHPLTEALRGAPGAGGVLDRRSAQRPALARYRRWHVALRRRHRPARALRPAPTACRTWNSTAAPRTRLRDGRVLFGGVRGLNLFDPRAHAPTPATCRRCGCCRPASAPTTPVDAGVLWQARALDVPTDAGLLRLRIGALDYRRPPRTSAIAIAWTVSIRAGSTTAAQPEITYTRAAAGRLRVPRAGHQPRWRVEPAGAAHAGARRAAARGGIRWRSRPPMRWPAWAARRDRLAAGTSGAGASASYFAQIREREERLKLALWASGEQFWDYDLARGEMHSMRADERRRTAPDIGVQSEVEQRHEIHHDDLPRVHEPLRQHLRGDAPLFLSEHRMRGAARAAGPGCARAAAWSSAMPTAAPCAWPAPPATSPPAATPSASAASPAKCCAAWPRRSRCSIAISISCRSIPPSPA